VCEGDRDKEIERDIERGIYFAKMSEIVQEPARQRVKRDDDGISPTQGSRNGFEATLSARVDKLKSFVSRVDPDAKDMSKRFYTETSRMCSDIVKAKQIPRNQKLKGVTDVVELVMKAFNTYRDEDVFGKPCTWLDLSGSDWFHDVISDLHDEDVADAMMEGIPDYFWELDCAENLFTGCMRSLCLNELFSTCQKWEKTLRERFGIDWAQQDPDFLKDHVDGETAIYLPDLRDFSFMISWYSDLATGLEREPTPREIQYFFDICRDCSIPRLGRFLINSLRQTPDLLTTAPGRKYNTNENLRENVSDSSGDEFEIQCEGTNDRKRGRDGDFKSKKR